MEVEGCPVSRCYVQLGAYGDAMNALPLAWEYSRIGERPHFLIGERFASLLDGCSYVIPDIWRGEWPDLAGAMAYAKANYDEVYCTQVYSTNYVHDPKTDSYCKDAWAQIGRSDWGSLPLVFDLRDPVREQRLIDSWKSDKPMILLSTKGNSSPFPHAADLEERITDEFERTHNIVPLDFNCERLFDLLGLYDQAAALVSIDTSTLHLAHASTVPVVALISSTSEWHGTPRYPGQRFRMRYAEYHKKPSALIEALHEVLRPRQRRTLIHVWSDYKRDGEAQRRHDVARKTWVREYNSGSWLSFPIQLKHVTRHSGSLGDPRPVPYVNDLVAEILGHPVEDSDLIILTNDDISFAPGLTDTLMAFQGECGYAHRRDFKSINQEVSTIGLAAGHKYPGVDLFAFTPGWWKSQKLPDMFVGRERWDLVTKAAMQLSGGIEIQNCCAHVQHASYWSTANNENTNPGNLWNRKQATNWFASKGLTPP